jgi:phage FluMu protein Com
MRNFVTRIAALYQRIRNGVWDWLYRLLLPQQVLHCQYDCIEPARYECRGCGLHLCQWHAIQADTDDYHATYCPDCYVLNQLYRDQHKEV